MAVAFVDETGDPGTGSAGRPWFCWVAFVVLNDFLGQMESVYSFLGRSLPGGRWPAGDFGGDDLIGTLRFMNCVPGWFWLTVASNTTFSTPATAHDIHKPTEHRYYTMLLMLERLSWLGEFLGEPVIVFIERPKGKSFSETSLRSRHKEGLPVKSSNRKWANYDFLPATNIFLTTVEDCPLLCVAHTLALAVGKAVNPHAGRSHTIPGEVFPEYLNTVCKRVWVGPWRNIQNLTDMGFTLVPWLYRTQLREQLVFLQAWLQEFGLAR